MSEEIRHFRVYTLSDSNHVVSGDWLEAPDEQTAIERVKSMVGKFALELWEGPRRIIRFEGKNSDQYDAARATPKRSP